mgnify:FL=1
MGCAVSNAATNQPYIFRGLRAPQVRQNVLSKELEQQLKQLQEKLSERSERASLLEALEQSLLYNPELAFAYSQIQQREWTLIAVRRQWYPSLTAFGTGPNSGLLGYGSTRTRLSTTFSNLTREQQSFEQRSQVGMALNLSWTFFDPSRNSEINAATDVLRSQELLFNVSARNLALQTQLAYFSLQEQEQLIASYQRILAATTTQVNQVEALFNIGNVSIADVEQIRTQQFQTLSLLIVTYRGLIDAAAALAQAMALPPGKLVLPADKLDRYGQWDLSLPATLQQALNLREEIQSSLALSNSANWRASALFNRYWPRFGIIGTGLYSDGLFRLNASNPLEPQSRRSRQSTLDASVGIGFNWSLFDGGISAAEAMAQKAVARQQNDQADLQRLQVGSEVERSFVAYQASLLELQSTEQQAAAAEQAATAVRERFNVGYSDMTSVVQTLNQSISAANAYARSIRQFNSSVAGLYRASAQWPDKALSLRDQREQILMRR